MNMGQWEKDSYERYSGPILDILSDGGWYTGDQIKTIILGHVRSRHDSLSVALALGVLHARKMIEQRIIEEDGLVKDFRYR